jgi:rhodanese-related sulfurtransferase
LTEARPLEITACEVRSMLQRGDDLHLLDCREPQEHRVASIEGAQLVPMGEIPGRLQELEAHADRTVVVVCHHGVRSLQVARYLREQGFEDARSMTGGIDAWSREVDPTVPRY